MLWKGVNALEQTGRTDFGKTIPHGRPIDVYSIGILCADIPVILPHDEVDFSLDSVEVPKIKVSSGGDASNAAVTLARLGVSVALGSIIGGDTFGQDILNQIESAGVITDFIKVMPELSTTVSVALINKSGDRMFYYHDSSVSKITYPDITTSIFKDVKHVNYGSIFGLSSLDPDADKILRHAKEAGCTTSMDATGNEKLLNYASIERTLDYVDYFMPSYREAKHFSGETDPRRMSEFFLRQTGVKTVVIKLGEKGCYVNDGISDLTSPAYDVKVVDTTGAGDSFVGGFLTGLLHGRDVEACAQLANAVAAYNSQFAGATSEKLSMENVKKLMKNVKT